MTGLWMWAGSSVNYLVVLSIHSCHFTLPGFVCNRLNVFLSRSLSRHKYMLIKHRYDILFSNYNFEIKHACRHYFNIFLFFIDITEWSILLMHHGPTIRFSNYQYSVHIKNLIKSEIILVWNYFLKLKHIHLNKGHPFIYYIFNKGEENTTYSLKTKLTRHHASEK